MLQRQRHETILRKLQEKGAISLDELSKVLDFSESTIRRDIEYLSSKEKLTKVRGGVVRTEDIQEESGLITSPFFVEKQKNEAAKVAIGKRAAKLLSGEESLIVNGGTTTWCLAKHFPVGGLTVSTNSLPVVDEVSRQRGNRCFVMGGELYPRHMLTLGFSKNEEPTFFGDYFFAGCQGISQWGIMEGDPQLAHFEQSLIANSEKLVILADSSKFLAKKSIIMSPLDRVDIIVTDSGIDDESKDMLKEAGVELLIADD